MLSPPVSQLRYPKYQSSCVDDVACFVFFFFSLLLFSLFIFVLVFRIYFFSHFFNFALEINSINTFDFTTSNSYYSCGWLCGFISYSFFHFCYDTRMKNSHMKINIYMYGHHWRLWLGIFCALRGIVSENIL